MLPCFQCVMVRHFRSIRGSGQITESFHLIPYPINSIPRRVCSLVFAGPRLYAVLTHLISSFRFGRLPVIRMPTLYILAAIHVTPTIAIARITNDSASSHVGILPAVQRTGVAIGVVNGTSESVRANVELGSFVSPKIDKYEIISRYVTGC